MSTAHESTLSAHSGQHRHESRQQFNGPNVFVLVDDGKHVKGIRNRSALHGRASGDRIMPRAASASDVRPAASAMFNGTERAARRKTGMPLGAGSPATSPRSPETRWHNDKHPSVGNSASTPIGCNRERLLLLVVAVAVAVAVND